MTTPDTPAPAEPRLYRIQSYPDNYIVGTLPDGNQTLIRLHWPDVHVVIFDEAGEFLWLESHPISAMLSERQDIRTTEFQEEWAAIERWTASIGFTEGIISVRKFTAIPGDLEILDLPVTYQVLLDEGAELEEDDIEIIEHWRRNEYFVLVCGRELDINKEGECSST